ncbi:pentatricopeptide repeat-containing protein At1g05750, chloroplastic-like [Rosa chinensis]|uniref:pentatricopeptide repeat-containing protein At1g05750, chloroplastic-like n=1 Tax=Rosa chinensis TaxID=74649 RepID=UPI001AD90632|nr:pentatricopeptide repeat-containing protein At1g05750, chloroplastic-like [Rosa chinensis]
MILPACTATPIQLPKQHPLTTTSHPSQSTSPNPKHDKKHSVSLRNRNESIDQTVLWTSSISQRCRSGQLSQAVSQFIQMRQAGVEPNHITFVTLFSGCAHFPAKAPLFGPSLHAYASKLGLDRTNVMVGTALVDMYAKSGRVELARLVFSGMEVKNSMSWNTMIDGYMRNGNVRDAVEVFDEMPERRGPL